MGHPARSRTNAARSGTGDKLPNYTRPHRGHRTPEQWQDLAPRVAVIRLSMEPLPGSIVHERTHAPSAFSVAVHRVRAHETRTGMSRYEKRSANQNSPGRLRSDTDTRTGTVAASSSSALEIFARSAKNDELNAAR